MKKQLLFLILFIPTLCHSQNDSTAIRETVLNYLEGFYTADGVRMAKALSPELAKRIVITSENGDQAIQDMSASLLIMATKKYKKSPDDTNEPFKADIRIYDILKNTATVKATANKFKFFDYIHLAKVNGEWKIINVLWQKTS